MSEQFANNLLLWGLGFACGILFYIVLCEPTIPDDLDE